MLSFVYAIITILLTAFFVYALYQVAESNQPNNPNHKEK